MGLTSSNKLVNVREIDCDGTVRVTLALTAAPDIIANPTDIALVLDRSGSMTGSPLASMKTGAKTFIRIIQEATGGLQTGEIGFGSRIGIVSFATEATTDAALITSVADLNAAVDALTADGRTNHADAFTKAIQLFDPASTNQRVIVMFTDGNTTVGLPPAPIAEAAKSMGIIIYVIGLIGSGGVDVDAITEWASEPKATHVAVTPNEADLEELFAELAANITNAGATEIVLDEVLNSDFAITSITAPSKGTATKLSDTRIRWEIDELGAAASESAILTFEAQHVGQSSGDKNINESITYTDREGNIAIFPNPVVTVDCGGTCHVEPCPVPTDLTADGCSDSMEISLGDVNLESQGRIVQLDLRLRNICPRKRVALAVLLSEIDSQGNEYQRGMKTMTIPAHNFPTCRDVTVRCIKFVLPEDLDVSGDTPDSICNARNLRARVIAHSIDSDYRCCECPITL